MSRFGRKSLIFLVIGAVALIGALAATAGDGDITVERKGSIHVVTVDDEGNRHEEHYDLDGDHPRRPFLGVMLEGRSEDGLRIRDIVSDSGAEQAGLRAGDVIVGLDGETIDSYRDLTRGLHEREPGDRVDVEVLRDGDRRTFTVELGEGGHWIGALHGFDAEALEERMQELQERLEGMDFDFDADAFEERMEMLNERLEGMNFDFNFDPGHNRIFVGHSRPRLGVELTETTPELREHLGGSRDAGVLVGRVLDDTPAEDAGVEVGDLIVAVDSDAIEGVGDLRRALRERAGQIFDLEIIRDGRPTTLSVSLPENDEDQTRESIRQHFERRHRAHPSADRT